MQLSIYWQDSYQEPHNTDPERTTLVTEIKGARGIAPDGDMKNITQRRNTFPEICGMNFIDILKVKGPLTIRSSRVRLWGCGAHLALLAKGASVQLPGHVASMTKPLLANQSSARKCHLPSRRSGTYLSTCTLTCFQTARWAGAGTEQREITLSRGFEPPTF